MAAQLYWFRPKNVFNTPAQWYKIDAREMGKCRADFYIFVCVPHLKFYKTAREALSIHHI